MKRATARLICAAALLLVVLAASLPSAAALPQRTVRIGAFNYYPGIFKGEDGSIRGFLVDTIGEVAKREGWRVEYVYGDFADGLARVRAGEVDLMTSVAWTAERARYLDYGKVPLLTVWGELYVPSKAGFQGIKDVAGKTVALMRGDFNGASFRNMVEKFGLRCRFVEYGNFEEIFGAVAAGRVDAGVVNNTFGAAKHNRYGLVSSGVIFNPFDIYLAAARNRNADLLATIDRYLQGWRSIEDSPYHKALDRWSHGDAASIQVLPHWLPPTLSGLVAFLALAAVFIVLLRHQVKRKTAEVLKQAGDRMTIEETLLFINDCGARHRADELLFGINRYLGNCLEADFVFVAQLLPEEGWARTHGLWARSGPVENMTYRLEGTPCEKVAGKSLCIYPEGVSGLFPEDRILAELGIEGYAGVPLWDSQGNGIGILGVLSRTRLGNSALVETVLNIASSRVAQELEAMRHLAVLNLKKFAMDNMKDAVYWIRPDGRICEVNGAASTMLGYREKDLLCMTVTDLRPCCVEKRWRAEWEELKRTGSLKFETTHRARDGSAVPVEITANYFSYDGAEYDCAIVRDITERKRMEEALEQRLAVLTEYSKVVECSRDLICVVDREYRYRMANATYLRYRGLCAEEVVGRTVEEVAGAENFAAMKHHIDACLNGQSERFDADLAYPGRGLRSFAITYTPVEEQGETARIACVISDQTEKRHLEEQLRQSQKMEAVGHLAGGIAHDFNNLLTVIVGYGNFLGVDPALGVQQKEQANQIVAAAERGAQLTRGLLAFSRKQVMNPQVLDLNALVGQVQQFLLRIIGEDVRLVFDPSAETMNVHGDASQLEQVLMNLATNARDAMPSGGVLGIETSWQEVDAAQASSQGNGVPGRYACLVVSDTGTGMDKGTRERIFEPFFTTKVVGKGTGLGMSIVYGIVKQHNGFINVYSEPEQGTVFKIYLPEAPDGEVEKERGEESAEPVRGTETVLVAEDDASVRGMVESLLKKYGYRVVLAVDGNDCVRQYREHLGEIDLVLTDVIMPGKNGREAFEEIKAIDPGARVLYSSGYTADFMKNCGNFDENTDLVMKPVQPAQLLGKVREVLDR